MRHASSVPPVRTTFPKRTARSPRCVRRIKEILLKLIKCIEANRFPSQAQNSQQDICVSISLSFRQRIHMPISHQHNTKVLL